MSEHSTIQNTCSNTKTVLFTAPNSLSNKLHTYNLCMTQSFHWVQPRKDHTVPLKHLRSKQCINIEALPQITQQY